MTKGKLTVIDSLISRSLAAHAGGVGFVLGGDVTFLRSVLSDFTSEVDRGALFHLAGGKVRLTSSNITSAISKASLVKNGGAGSFECYNSQLMGEVGRRGTLFEKDTVQHLTFTMCSVQHLAIASQLLQPMVARNSRF